jgi:hypothetical protein
MTPALLSAAVLNAVAAHPEGVSLAQVVEDLAHKSITARPSHVGICLNRHLRADSLALRDGRWHVVDRSAAAVPTGSPYVASTRVLELRRSPARRRARRAGQPMTDQEINHGSSNEDPAFSGCTIPTCRRRASSRNFRCAFPAGSCGCSKAVRGGW